MEKESLSEKLIQCQQGQTEAFSWLAAEYGPRLYRYFYRITASQHDAEDLLQELFVKLIEKIGTYRHQGRFENWLFSIAANLARDRGRRCQRTAKIFTRAGNFDEKIKMTPAQQASPEENLHRTELHARLQQALAQLPEADRRIILMRHYGQLSFAELAEHFHIPLGTALAKVHRGLKRLQRIMTENERK